MNKSNSACWTSLSAAHFLVVILFQSISAQLKSPAKMMCSSDLHWVIWESHLVCSFNWGSYVACRRGRGRYPFCSLPWLWTIQFRSLWSVVSCASVMRSSLVAVNTPPPVPTFLTIRWMTFSGGKTSLELIVFLAGSYKREAGRTDPYGPQEMATQAHQASRRHYLCFAFPAVPSACVKCKGVKNSWQEEWIKSARWRY